MLLREVKAYQMWSMIGEIGGYVGMFLGYSVLQLPDFICDIISSFHNIAVRKRYKLKENTVLL